MAASRGPARRRLRPALKADEGMTDRDIASGLLSEPSLTRFVKEELDSAPAPSTGPAVHVLIAIACSDAADPTACDDKVVAMGFAESISLRPETVRQILKKTNSSLHPGGRGGGSWLEWRTLDLPRRLRPGPSRGLFRRDKDDKRPSSPSRVGWNDMTDEYKRNGTKPVHVL